MESAAPIVPLPSAHWGTLAASHGEAGAPIAATTTAAPRHADDAAQLKARLLRMIVANEHTRKLASTEASNGR
jgi:hypothetical protein